LLIKCSPHSKSKEYFGNIFLKKYQLLSSTKQIYARRIARSLLYYIFATIIGLYLLLTQIKQIDDFYIKYTPLMHISFCIAITHFLLNIVEDTLAREHMVTQQYTNIYATIYILNFHIFIYGYVL
jgi:hypothetical protein